MKKESIEPREPKERTALYVLLKKIRSQNEKNLKIREKKERTRPTKTT